MADQLDTRPESGSSADGKRGRGKIPTLSGSNVASSGEVKVKEEEVDDEATTGAFAQDDHGGHESIDDSNLMDLSEGYAQALGYPFGCPVWYNFQATSSDESAFSAGIIKTVLMNAETRKLVFRVESNNNNDDASYESVETIINEENVAYADNCPVRVKMNHKDIDGKIICAKPIFKDDGKMLDMVNYTVILFLEGNRRKLVENIPPKIVRYRKVEENVIDMSILNRGEISSNQTSESATRSGRTELATRRKARSYNFNMFNNEATTENGVSSTTQKKSCSDSCSPALSRDMPWPKMWKRMKSEGWAQMDGSGLIAWYYLHPTCAGMKKTDILRDKEEGTDYFANADDLKWYARVNLGWKTDTTIALCADSPKDAEMADRVKKRKRGKAEVKPAVEMMKEQPKKEPKKSQAKPKARKAVTVPKAKKPDTVPNAKKPVNVPKVKKRVKAPSSDLRSPESQGSEGVESCSSSPP